MSDREAEDGRTPEEPPAVFWARLYALEFVNLALLVIFFYFLTKYFE